MNRLRAVSIAALAVAAALVLTPITVLGTGRHSGDSPQAVPWVFVGTAAQCGGPAGSRIVTSAWLGGMGLPDNGGQNGVAATTNDPHRGLLLSKNGPTNDCSSAGATITGVQGLTVGPTFTLGFDYRNGGHCGAGAPRFNLKVQPPTGPVVTYFVGCANAPQTPAPQDPAEWTRTRSVLVTCGVECFPGPIPAGSKIKSIDIVFDEGTNSTSLQDPNGIGLAVIDNININGTVIASGTGSQPGGGGPGDNKGGGNHDGHDGDGHDHDKGD